jgi:hypothetical protein
MSWESDNAHELQVQFVYCDGRGPQFSIQCRRFKPEKTDIRTRKWGPGGHQILEIPTYCAQDIVDLRNQISRMVDRYKIHILSVVTFGSPDTPEVVVKTINMAMNRQVCPPILGPSYHAKFRCRANALC